MEGEYEASLSCLLETTTHNYCSVKDAYHLLKSGIAEFGPELNRTGDGIELDHPLAGYYILVRDVPKATVWLKDIARTTPPS
jgi:hypothetical protein